MLTRGGGGIIVLTSDLESVCSSERENAQQSTVKEHMRARYFSLQCFFFGKVKIVRTK